MCGSCGGQDSVLAESKQWCLVPLLTDWAALRICSSVEGVSGLECAHYTDQDVRAD